jgi:hypothetical protein
MSKYETKYHKYKDIDAIWVRFPGIIHGLEIKEAETLMNNLKRSLEAYYNGIDEGQLE